MSSNKRIKNPFEYEQESEEEDQNEEISFISTEQPSEIEKNTKGYSQLTQDRDTTSFLRTLTYQDSYKWC